MWSCVQGPEVCLIFEYLSLRKGSWEMCQSKWDLWELREIDVPCGIPNGLVFVCTGPGGITNFVISQPGGRFLKNGSIQTKLVWAKRCTLTLESPKSTKGRGQRGLHSWQFLIEWVQGANTQNNAKLNKVGSNWEVHTSTITPQDGQGLGMGSLAQSPIFECISMGCKHPKHC